MSDRSTIDWCAATIQPITGCTQIDSETGCRNCYACRLAATRLRYLPQYAGLTSSSVALAGERAEHHWTGEVRFNPAELEKPLRWQKPRTIFVSSMGDLFHDSVKDEWIDAVVGIAASCGQHQFVLLTKRPQRMRTYFAGLETRGADSAAAYERRVRAHFEKYKCEFHEGYSLPAPPTPQVRAAYDSLLALLGEEASPCERTLRRKDLPECHWREWPLDNLALGVSCSTQAECDERIPVLLETPARWRFVSLEPLLGPVDLTGMNDGLMCALTGWWATPGSSGCQTDGLTTWGEHHSEPVQHTGGPKLDGVILGCETGPGARPMNPDWAREVREQCAEANVPFFLKALDASGRVNLDGWTHDELPWGVQS